MSAALTAFNPRAPAFVSNGSKTLQEEEEEGQVRQANAEEPERDEEEDGSESSTSSGSDSGSENDDGGSSPAPSPRVRDADNYNGEEQTTGDWAWVSGMPRDRVPVMSPQEKPGKEKEAAQQRLLLGVRLALVLHSPPEKNAAR